MKNKIIEEMKKEIIKGFKQADCRKPYTNEPYPYFDSQILNISEALYNAGYRKVPYGAVILSPEERDDEIKTYNEERVEFEKRIERLNSQLVEYANENLKLKAEKREYEKPIDKFIKDREAQAVREFTEKLKARLANFIWKHNIPECIFNDVMADLLKEVENGEN